MIIVLLIIIIIGIAIIEVRLRQIVEYRKEAIAKLDKMIEELKSKQKEEEN